MSDLTQGSTIGSSPVATGTTAGATLSPASTESNGGGATGDIGGALYASLTQNRSNNGGQEQQGAQGGHTTDSTGGTGNSGSGATGAEQEARGATPNTAANGSEAGAPQTTQQTTGTDAGDDIPTDLPLNQQDRFREVISARNQERQAREALEQQLRQIQQQQSAWNPVQQFLQQEGYATPEAFLQAITAQQQQSADQQYEQQQRDKYEGELYDPEIVDALVQRDMQLRRTMREGEELRQRMQADSQQIEMQRRFQQTDALLSDVYRDTPILREFAVGQDGLGLGQRIINELRTNGNASVYTPENLAAIAKGIAGEIEGALKAAVAKAETDAIVRYTQTKATAPRTLPQGGGDAPASVVNDDYRPTGDIHGALMAATTRRR